MDLRRYQLEETLSNLTLLQSHLEDLLEGKDRRFCLDCALKHASAVLGLAKENSGFWPDEEIWPELRDWASRLLWALPSLERTTARSWRDECREFRKRVASLIGGECPTCQEVRPIMKVLVRKPIEEGREEVGEEELRSTVYSAIASPGIPIDPERARRGVCKYFEFHGKRYYFCPGVIGLITEEEFKREGYGQGGVIPLSREAAEHIRRRWTEAKTIFEALKALPRQKWEEVISKIREVAGVTV